MQFSYIDTKLWKKQSQCSCWHDCDENNFIDDSEEIVVNSNFILVKLCVLFVDIYVQ
jgi:hypothetical protein